MQPNKFYSILNNAITIKNIDTTYKNLLDIDKCSYNNSTKKMSFMISEKLKPNTTYTFIDYEGILDNNYINYFCFYSLPEWKEIYSAMKNSNFNKMITFTTGNFTEAENEQELKYSILINVKTDINDSFKNSKKLFGLFETNKFVPFHYSKNDYLQIPAIISEDEVTEDTKGILGQTYINSKNDSIYMCIDRESTMVQNYYSICASTDTNALKVVETVSDDTTEIAATTINTQTEPEDLTAIATDGTVYVKLIKKHYETKYDWKKVLTEDDSFTKEELEEDVPNSYRYVREVNYGSNYDNWKRFGCMAVFNNGMNIAPEAEITCNFTPMAENSNLTPCSDIRQYVDSIESNYILGHYHQTCWIQLDFGKLRAMDNIFVLHKVDSRLMKFNIEVSKDGITWRTIYDYKKDGTYESTVRGKIFPITESKENILNAIYPAARLEGEDNDSPRIQRAINIAKYTTGLVKLRALAYKCSKELKLLTGVKIEGTGPLNSYVGSTVLYLNNNSNCKLLSMQDAGAHYMQVQNIIFLGNNTNQTKRNALVDFNCFVTGYLKDIVVMNSYGPGLMLSNGASDYIFENVWVQGCNVGKYGYSIDINPLANYHGLLNGNFIYAENPYSDYYKIDKNENYIDKSGNIILTKITDGVYSQITSQYYEICNSTDEGALKVVETITDSSTQVLLSTIQAQTTPVDLSTTTLDTEVYVKITKVTRELKRLKGSRNIIDANNNIILITVDENNYKDADNNKYTKQYYNDNIIDSNKNIIMTRLDNEYYKNNDDVIFIRQPGERTFLNTTTNEIVTASSLGLVGCFSRTDTYNRGNGIRVRNILNCNIRDIHVEGTHLNTLTGNAWLNIDKWSSAWCGMPTIDYDGNPIPGIIIEATGFNRYLRIGGGNNQGTTDYYFKNNTGNDNYTDIPFNYSVSEFKMSNTPYCTEPVIGTNAKAIKSLSLIAGKNKNKLKLNNNILQTESSNITGDINSSLTGNTIPTENTLAMYLGQTYKCLKDNKLSIYMCTEITLTKTTIVKDLTSSEEKSNNIETFYPRYYIKYEDSSIDNTEDNTNTSITYSYSFKWDKQCIKDLSDYIDTSKDPVESVSLGNRFYQLEENKLFTPNLTILPETANKDVHFSVDKENIIDINSKTITPINVDTINLTVRSAVNNKENTTKVFIQPELKIDEDGYVEYRLMHGSKYRPLISKTATNNYITFQVDSIQLRNMLKQPAEYSTSDTLSDEEYIISSDLKYVAPKNIGWNSTYEGEAISAHKTNRVTIYIRINANKLGYEDLPTASATINDALLNELADRMRDYLKDNCITFKIKADTSKMFTDLELDVSNVTSSLYSNYYQNNKSKGYVIDITNSDFAKKLPENFATYDLYCREFELADHSYLSTTTPYDAMNYGANIYRNSIEITNEDNTTSTEVHTYIRFRLPLGYFTKTVDFDKWLNNIKTLHFRTIAKIEEIKQTPNDYMLKDFRTINASPTTSTFGIVGQHLLNSSSNKLYECISVKDVIVPETYRASTETDTNVLTIVEEGTVTDENTQIEISKVSAVITGFEVGNTVVYEKEYTTTEYSWLEITKETSETSESKLESFEVLEDNWVQDTEYTDVYKTTITHNLKTKSLQAHFYVNNQSEYCEYEIVDANTIIIYNDRAISGVLIISY